MIANKSVVRGLLALSMGLMPACITRGVVELQNAGSEAVVVRPKGQESCRTPPGAICRFWFAEEVVVDKGDSEYRFHLMPVLSDSEERVLEMRGPFEQVLKLRLSSSGRIFVVEPNGTEILAGQPKGYPLEHR
jgi:hypothetical protein